MLACQISLEKPPVTEVFGFDIESDVEVKNYMGNCIMANWK